MSHPVRAAIARAPMARAVASILVLSIVLPQAGSAADAARFADVVAWGMQSDSAEEFAGHALNAGLDRGLAAARATGLPFLGSIEGGITYDHALRRFDYDLLAMLRLLGDGEGHTWLAQLGVHDLRDRRTLNAGLVYRWVDADAGWLFGANAFFDRDVDAGAERLGAGLEAMTETARVFANAYVPHGGWVDSPVDPLLQERPARGHDVGVAWTPRRMPSVDLQLRGAQWKGAAVDVFGTGDTERDPTVWSAKLGLAPVPALRVDLEHSRIAGGAEDLRLSLNWTHRFGMSGLAQWTPGHAAMRNDLRQRALMPVEREKRIVMETRDRFAAPLFAGDALQAVVLEGEAFEHLVQVTGGALPLAFVLEGADAALFELSDARLRLPAQDSEAPADADGDNVYDATVRVTDARGRQAQQRIAVTVQAAVPGVRNARIEGEAKVDRTLTLSFDYHSPIDAVEDPSGRGIQWFRRAMQADAPRAATPSTVDIVGATGPTYVPVAADIGHVLGARIVVRSVDGRSNEARPAEVVGERVHEGSAPTAAPSIGGVFEVGAVLTGSVGYADADGDAEGEHLYQWYRADDPAGTTNVVAIAGANAPTHTMTSADQGKYLVFEVTPRSATGFPDVGEPTRAMAAGIGTGSAPVARDVGISGDTKVGEWLSTQYVHDDADGDLQADGTYQWYRADDAAGVANRTAIAGATATTYRIAGADQGKYLVFEVTPKSQTGFPDVGEPGRAVTTTTVTGTAPVANNLRIEGAPTVGEALTGRYDYADADGDEEGDTAIQWYRQTYALVDGLPVVALHPITGATSARYEVAAADVGQALVFEVTPKSSTGHPDAGAAVRTATVIVEGRAPTASNVRMTGSPVVGARLSIEYEYADADGDAEGASAVTWCYDGGACWQGERTFLVPAEAEGKQLVASIVPKSATGSPNTGLAVAAEPTSVVTRVTAVADPTERSVLADMPMEPFRPLKASGGTPPYTYEAIEPLPDGVRLDAATGEVSGSPAAWMPAWGSGSEGVGWWTAFRVKDANNVYAATYVNVKILVHVPDAPKVLTLAIVGTVQVGSTLSGDEAVWMGEGGADPEVLFQWYRADDATGRVNLSAIPGATSRNHVVTTADRGKYLVLQVTPRITRDVLVTGIALRRVTAQAVP